MPTHLPLLPFVLRRVPLPQSYRFGQGRGLLPGLCVPSKPLSEGNTEPRISIQGVDNPDQAPLIPGLAPLGGGVHSPGWIIMH